MTQSGIEPATSIRKQPGSNLFQDTDCANRVTYGLFSLSNQIPGLHRGADKSLTRRTSRCVLFDGENILFDASLVIYINSTNIPPIIIINRIYETQNILSL
jgi:hypothetical protein